MVAPSPSRMKSTWIGKSRTGSRWKSRGITRCFLPSRSMSKSVVRNRPARMRWRSSRSSTEMVTRGLVVAIDHSGHSPGATLCPGGPLAALRTCGRLQFLDGRRHCLKSLFCKKLKAAARPIGVARSKPPGVRGLRTWRAFSPKEAEMTRKCGDFYRLRAGIRPAADQPLRVSKPTGLKSEFRRAWPPAPRCAPSAPRSPRARGGPCP